MLKSDILSSDELKRMRHRVSQRVPKYFVELVASRGVASSNLSYYPSRFPFPISKSKGFQIVDILGIRRKVVVYQYVRL